MTTWELQRKIHNAIKENAENANCKELLKLIAEAEKRKLTFVYAYNKQWNPDSTIMPYIEVLDEYTFNKYNIRLFIVRNQKETKINNERIVVNNETNERASFDLATFNKVIERFKNLQEFAEIINNFDLAKLPIMRIY